MVVGLSFACGGEPGPPPRAQAPAAQPRATAPAPPAPPVEIVRISPETVEVRGGRVVPTTFTIEYRIAHPEKIKEAEIRVSSEGFGIGQMAVKRVHFNE